MKHVEVYRLISTGTIEEMMYIRQIYKTQVAEAATTQQGAGPRQFNAVHGAKGEEGELFGTYVNLLLKSVDSVLRLATIVSSATAGITVLYCSA
jgi:hypothetical protein